MRILVIVTLWLAPAMLIAIAFVLFRRIAASSRSLQRLFTEVGDVPEQIDAESAVTGFLRRWLMLAGYRDPNAPTAFVAATLLMIGLGFVAVFVAGQSGLTGSIAGNIALLPAGASEIFLPIVYLAPWTVLLMLAVMPWLVVRRARRQRVENIEQDLPISLELMATLSEAGLGFDAALARTLESVMEDRPLARDFRSYQSDLLAGRTRVEALRRFARRIEISSVTILVSALVQAEQLGTGIARALRHQADDLRDRRRERANAFAMALPVKRMFPLVMCFMPGIFVWTLGPFFVQLFQIADTFVKVRNF